MLFCDLLRATVLLTGALATVLGAVSVLAASSENDTTALIVAGAWWLIAAILGIYAGRSNSAGEAMARTLAGAKTMTSLPSESPARIGFARLWPILAFGLVCGALAVVFPPVAVIGTGYAICVALIMRRREAAVTAIEERDGVRFYVEPSGAFTPLKLIRTPGLYRDRPPAAKPPPPSRA
ncbi:hypothetical protein HJD18_15965 [Thermoleophilia bacterium SCSIO 60948]|nr:hypothetical protein HJD18_15965 [Thermoleophilia bacterium SCSIO 60948]